MTLHVHTSVTSPYYQTLLLQHSLQLFIPSGFFSGGDFHGDFFRGRRLGKVWVGIDHGGYLCPHAQFVRVVVMFYAFIIKGLCIHDDKSVHVPVIFVPPWLTHAHTEIQTPLTSFIIGSSS